jgi:ABC-type antimicrobial peptide transport system permease subunit
MFRNYFLITLRNIFKNGFYSFINITGLAIGISCSLLILLWVSDEMSFDKFIPKSDRIYQVWAKAEFNNDISSWTSVPMPTYEAMKTADNNIVNATIADWGGEQLVTVGDNRLLKRGFRVGSEFLEIFEFPLLAGSATTVLDDPTSIVISQELATMLFGEEDPINQVIRLNDESDMKVTGVLQDVPKNSSFQFDFLVSWQYYMQTSNWVMNSKDNWGNYSFQVFVELDDPANMSKVDEVIRPMLTENGEDDIPREFFLYPMLRWRLFSNFERGKESGGMNDYVQLFSIIAVFIIVIACINFMNLATARSERRAKEVGIRKSIGSKRYELIMQFMGESLFISLLAYVVAILLAQLLIPFYNELVDKQLFIDYTSSQFVIYSLLIILITGVLSGSYPALYLSSFQPVKVLKGKVSTGKNGSLPRKVLVTIQFGFSILLIIGTLVILQQIDMVRNRELGYDQEKLITIRYTEEIEKNYDVLKTELLRSGAISSMTKSNSDVTSINSNNFLGWPGKPEDERVIFTTVATEYDYAKTMGIKMLMGRDFSKDFISDTSAIIVNKAALELMDLEEPIGTELDLWGEKRPLIGVIDDVLMGSLYREVKPMFLILNPNWAGSVTIRLQGDVAAALAEVEDKFKIYNSAYPFEYTFVDDDFAEKFKTINMTSTLASLFATLTIVITGLGLFGLAAFTAEQRTKEIGVRKVLGASVSSLISLISKDFSKLVIVSFLIASPLAWWLLNMYLERYPIRIEIGWWIFPITGMVSLLFALFIVVTQVFKAAKANPVTSLRNE